VAVAWPDPAFPGAAASGPRPEVCPPAGPERLRIRLLGWGGGSAGGLQGGVVGRCFSGRCPGAGVAPRPSPPAPLDAVSVKAAPA